MADNYGTIAEANAYHAARGNAAWAAAVSDALRDAALLRASVWIDGSYREQFGGYKSGRRAQIREWPRAGALDAEYYPIPFDEVPIEVRNATYEAALREVVSPGSLSPDFVAATQVARKKVGPIEVEYRESYGADSVRPCVQVVEDILAPLISWGRGPMLFGSAGRA